MKRRLVAVRSGNDGRSSSARLNDPMEKTLTEIQLKIMDSVRPLLHLKEELGCLGASRYLKRAANTALSLVGNAFADITKRRRFNVLNQTDNRYVSLLEEKDRFSVRESENLFGRHFFRPMVKTAQEGDNLMNMNRSGGHISHASNGCNRGRSGFDGRSSDRLRFNSRGGGYSAGSNNDHRLDRYDYIAPVSVSYVFSISIPFAGRVKWFVPMWQSLTKDPWVLDTVTNGLSLDFKERPGISFFFFSPFMRPDQIEICRKELMEMEEKSALVRVG